MYAWKKIRRTISYGLIYWMVLFFIFFSNLLPRKLWIRFLGFLGSLSYYVAIPTRKLVIQHLRMAYAGEKSDEEIVELAKKVFLMLGRNGADVIRNYRERELAYYDKFVRVKKIDIALKARDAGKGIVFVVPHIGAIEVLANQVALRGFDPYVVGTPLKNKRLNSLLWKQRSKHGARPVIRGEDTLKLIKALLTGGSVALLIDQDTKVKSCFVNFFGRPASTPIGAAMLAMRTKSVVIPAHIYMDDELNQNIEFLDPIELINTGDTEKDAVTNTQLFASVNEAQIRQHPEQWLWMHKRWKTQPSDTTSL